MAWGSSFIRLRGLLVVALAALGITALLPLTSASATTYTPAFDCASSPTHVTAGGTVTVNGSLSTGITPLSGAAVEVDYSYDGGATWTRYALGTTDSTGHVSWPGVVPAATAIWSCYYNGTTVTTLHGTDTYTPATSPSFPITVTPPPSLADTEMDKAATPSTITAGQVTSISVTLRSGTTPVAGRTVYLNYYRPDSGGWQHLCVRTTGSTGSANCPDSPSETTTYAWGFDGDSTYDMVTSGNFVVTVNPGSTPPATTTATRLTVTATPTTVSPGSATRITGYLETSLGAPIAGRTVHLLANGVSVGDAVSDGGGFLQFVAYPTATTQYDWQFSGDATYAATTSTPSAIVTVDTSSSGVGSLTAHVNRHNIQRGHRLRIWGTYSNPLDSGRVVLYRQTATGRVRVASTPMDSDGYYLFRLRPRHRGTKHYVTEVVDAGQPVDAATLTVHVR